MPTALYLADCILLLLLPPSLTCPASSPPAHFHLLSSSLSLLLPSIPLHRILFRIPASFFHHCAGHTSSLYYFTIYFPLTFFLHPSSHQPTALPHKTPLRFTVKSKRSIQSIYQTEKPTDPPTSNRCVSGHPIRVFLSPVCVSCERNAL